MASHAALALTRCAHLEILPNAARCRWHSVTGIVREFAIRWGDASQPAPVARLAQNVREALLNEGLSRWMQVRGELRSVNYRGIVLPACGCIGVADPAGKRFATVPAGEIGLVHRSGLAKAYGEWVWVPFGQSHRTRQSRSHLDGRWGGGALAANTPDSIVIIKNNPKAIPASCTRSCCAARES